MLLSVYVPPRVWYFPGGQKNYPRYRADRLVVVPGGSFVADYWFGEDTPGVCTGQQDPVMPGSWGTVGIKHDTQLPDLLSGAAGVGIGLSNSPEDLPLDPHAARAEVKANAGAAGLYALAGALQAGTQNTFVLQRNASGEYRLILIARSMDSGQDNYWGYRMRVPVLWGPETIGGR